MQEIQFRIEFWTYQTLEMAIFPEERQFSNDFVN